MAQHVHPHILEVVYGNDVIQHRITELAHQINQDYSETKELIVVCILKGASIFTADLIRHLTVPCLMGFMAISSYGNSKNSSGTVRILMDLNHDITGKDVLVVEDILDTGLTAKKLLELLKTRSPRTLNITCLLQKPTQHVMIDIKYIGFRLVKDEFVVGYGMDFCEKYRELGYIGILKPEVYQKTLESDPTTTS